MSPLLRVTFTLQMIGILFIFQAKGQTIIPEKAGKGIMFIASDSSFSLKLNGRIQNLYTGKKDLDNNHYTDGFSIRRARLKLEGFAFSPDWEYKIQLGLSNQDIAGGSEANSKTANIVLDAIAKWNFAPGYSLWFGQGNLPGNRERLLSSQKLHLVDRSLLNAHYNLDRDAGIQLHHQAKLGKTIFRQIASVSMGEGRNITTENAGGYDYTARMELLPFGDFNNEDVGPQFNKEISPKLSFGISYDFNDNATRERGQTGQFFSQQRDLKTVFADGMFKFKRFSVMAEYANRMTSGSPVVKTGVDGTVNESFYTGTGFNIQANYQLKNNFELAGRFTDIHPEYETQREKNNQFTLGVSKYILGHVVKVQSDVSLLKEETDFTEIMYRFQVEAGF